MATTSDDGAVQRRPSRRQRSLVILVVVFVGWLAIGAVRAPAIARNYFAQAHGSGATITSVEVHGAIPLIPPFWGVSVVGTVSEPQMGGTGYTSPMLLCIELITGWVIRCGSG